MRRLSLALLFLLPTAAFAGEPRFELTPAVGFTSGGSIRVEDHAFTFTEADVDLGDSGSFSLVFGIPLAEGTYLELTAMRQDTELEDTQGLFGEDPGWVLPVGDPSALDTDLTTLHIGGAWQLGARPNRWYLAASVGVTQLDFALPADDDARLSVSAGAGYTMDLSERLGIRFGARVLWVDTDEGTARTFEFEHPDCGASCYYVYSYDDYILQTQVSVGLVIGL